MRLIFLAVFLIVNLLGAKHCNAQGPGTFQWTNGAPNNNPGLSGAKFAVDKNTYRWYEWVSGTSWIQSGDRIQRISGCSAPNYTPNIHQSHVVINGCNLGTSPQIPELYAWMGSDWVKLNDGGGATYTAGAGISISGSNVISADTSLLATQYDISQLGVTFPLLAPNSTSPSYGFIGNGGLYRASPDSIILRAGMLNSTTSNSLHILTENAQVPRDITVRSGSKTTAGGFGSSLNFTSGNGATAGFINFTTGIPTFAGTGRSGTINFTTGQVSGTNRAGGINISGGSNSTGTGSGGAIVATGGYSELGSGGSVNFTAGGSNTGSGGSITFQSGNSAGAASGNINFTTFDLLSASGGSIIFTTGLGTKNPATFNTAGIQYNGLTTEQRDALTGLTAGRVLWNSTDSKLQVFNGSTWENLH